MNVDDFCLVLGKIQFYLEGTGTCDPYHWLFLWERNAIILFELLSIPFLFPPRDFLIILCLFIKQL